MANAERKHERTQKFLSGVSKFVEPNERITRVIRGTAGDDPSDRDSGLTSLLNQWLLIAFTDRNIVLLTCWPLTIRPRRLLARLPLNTRLGPVNHRDAWSIINLKAAFATDVHTWVPRRFYPYIDAHDKALNPSTEER